MSIIIFIIILGTLVLVHELGHFIAAKRSGIRVDEFGIGFPPRLFSKTIGETRYSINLFPLGGFVKIFGENPDAESVEQDSPTRSLVKKPKYIQAWVIVAGIVFNLLFAWLALSVGFMVGMPYSADDSAFAARVQNPILTITQVLPKSPADLAGFKSGDEIIALSSGKVEIERPGVKETQDFIASHEQVTVAFSRGAETETSTVRGITGIVGSRRAIGISLDMTGTLRLPFFEAICTGFTTTMTLTGDTVTGMYNVFKNIFVGQADFSQISGPVGIVGVVRDASALGYVHLITLMALISINLAVINFLPFPALDGGRLFFLLIETIKRSPINARVANIVNGVGFVLLVVLMVVVTYHDIIRLLHR